MPRVRPALIAATVVAGVLAAGAVAFWAQRDFWSQSAAHYLRERLAEDLGADFQSAGPRVRWFPPSLSFGQVTFHRRGEPWVLVAEDLRVSFNLYAVLLGRERLGRVVVVRPRVFVRARAGGGDAAPAAAGAGGTVRLALPLRMLQVEDGRVDYRGPGGAMVVLDGIDLLVDVTGASARGRLLARRVAADVGGRRRELGTLAATAALAAGRVDIRELALEGGTLGVKLAGSVGLDGGLELQGTAEARLADLAREFGGPPAAGAVRVAGTVGGRLGAPVLDGTLALVAPAVRGRGLPALAGAVTLAGGRLALESLAGRLGGGTIALAGEAQLDAEPVRWRAAITARGVDLGKIGLPEDSPLRRAGAVAGTLEATGTGTAWDGLEAAVSFSASSTVAGWPLGEATAAGAFALAGRGVRIDRLEVASGGLAVSGSGVWSPGAGLVAELRGSLADLAPLGGDGAAKLGGRASFAGTVAGAGRDLAFTGRLRLDDGAAGSLRGVAAEARVRVGATALLLEEGTFRVPGGSGTLAGRVSLPGGELELAATLPALDLAAAGRLLGADAAGLAGVVRATAAIRGTARAPTVEGRLRGGPLRRGAFVADDVAASFRWGAGRLDVREASLARGSTRLALRGALEGGRIVAGSFVAAPFDLRDILPAAGFELAGSAKGTIAGPLGGPAVSAVVMATRLRRGALDLRGGALEVESVEGVVTVRGWIGAEENRVRAVFEPAFAWRFEADLSLVRLSSELLLPAGGERPKGLARGLARAGFLASGEVRASGRLLDPSSIEADVRLDSLWFQGAGRTLRNVAPVRASWREGRLRVEDLRLAGDQYRVQVSGTAGPASGWALEAEGRVSLALLEEYWDELLEIEGSAEIRLRLGGPWDAPSPEGTVTVAEGFVRTRSLPEPLEQVAGRFELHAGTIDVTALTGTIDGNPFRGSGRYRFGADHLDAEVEGRLDLALFRARLPAARELHGPAEVRLRLEGPIAAPRFSGAIEILDAELALRPFPAKITGVRGKVSLGVDSLEVRELTGQTGAGRLRLAGSMSWRSAPARVDFDLEGRDILLGLTGVAKIQADLDLGLHGDFDDLALRGQVTILKGRYLLAFGEAMPAVGGGESQGPPERGMPDLSRTALEVRVRADDNVWISNDTAKIEAAVALDVGGTLGQPVLRGEVTAIQGEAYYLSRFFRLESATLRFVPPSTVPLLDLQASTAVGETQVLFLMGGPVDDLTFHLTSLPAMPQEELISLLTVGQTRANIERRGDQAAAVGAAVFTSEPIVNALGDTARSSLGLEVLQLEPIVGEDSQVSARLTLGTHLSDRLFVSYTQNLGETQDQQVRVEYSILDYLALWGRQMRQGIYSLDLVFRYAFR